MRNAVIRRKTAETEIELFLELDGDGSSECRSGCGFLDHMLTLFARHGGFTLKLTCKGDVEVDDHHTVEDIGICLGKAFAQALGEKRGITRYGSILLPMDEALILAAADLSGRAGCFCELQIPTEKVGTFDTQLCEEFYRAFTGNSGITLHLKQLAGSNSHHIIEGTFKAAARCLAQAVQINEREKDRIPSTKGYLE